MEKDKNIEDLIRELNHQQINELSKKKGISYEKAKLLIAEERLTDKKLEIKIIADSLIFSFDKELILKFIKPISISNKRRIRYILQLSIGKINFQFRHFYLSNSVEKGHNQSIKLKEAYYETKEMIWQLRYKEPEYYHLLSNIFIEYLNKCYVIFFEFLSLHNKNRLYGSHAFSKEEMLKSVLIHPLTIQFHEMHQEFMKEIEDKFNSNIDEDRNHETETRGEYPLNYERAIMNALENGYGEYFGFD